MNAGRTSRGHLLLVAVLLALFYGLALSATLDKCVFHDEIAHLTAGYSYWLFNDYRLHPENGNLPQRWAALPLLIAQPTFPDRDQTICPRSHVWKVGMEFFYHRGNDPDRMLLMSRAMIGVMGVLLGLLVYGYSRWLFGPAAGLLSLTLFVICPNLLAHGPLVNSDTTACLFFLGSLAAIWWAFHEITWSSLIVSGLVLGGLFVSKFSAVIILPVMGLLAMVRIIDGRPLPARLWGKTPRIFVLHGIRSSCCWASLRFKVSRSFASSGRFTASVTRRSTIIGRTWINFRRGWESVLDGWAMPTEVNEMLMWSARASCPSRSPSLWLRPHGVPCRESGLLPERRDWHLRLATLLSVCLFGQDAAGHLRHFGVGVAIGAHGVAALGLAGILARFLCRGSALDLSRSLLGDRD